MKSRDYKAFIVEGEAREPQIIRNLCQVYFRHSNFKILTLPAGQNIYMLWKKMKEDEFETDIIEVLRESSADIEEKLADLSRDDFSEVFLFFDYDGHQDNLCTEHHASDAVNEMLQNFNNETENGKLYINYPMVEALRDFEPGICGNYNDCYCDLEQSDRYKQRSADQRLHKDFRKYTFEVWKEILNVFVMRISCLLDEDGIISHDRYKESADPHAVYQHQQKDLIYGKVFILSAFPEFLLDYFPVSFWNSCIKCSKRKDTGKKCKNRHKNTRAGDT